MAFWNKWFGKSRKARLADANAEAEAARAKRIAEAAMVNPADSGAAKTATDTRLRRLQRGRGIAGTATGARSAAVKTLLGE